MALFILFIFSILSALFFKYAVKGYSALSNYLTAISIIIFCYFILGFFEILFEETSLLNLISFLKIFLNCFVILLCAMLIIAEILIIKYSRKRTKANSKYALVLGAEVINGKPAKILTERIKAAKEFLDLYPETIAILSGGKVQDMSISEAECMENALIDMGIDKNRLILEDKSRNTVENFEFTKKILENLGQGSDEITIITSDTHLYRACYLAKKSGFKPFPFYAKTPYPVLKLSVALKEAVALYDQWLFKNKKHGK